MKKFIGYYDYLGFKDFILNNDHEYQRNIMGNIFRDIESSLGRGMVKEGREGILADLKDSRINCINFSDTIIFWTNDDSIDSLYELIEVTHKFNWQTNIFFFPARGAIHYGEIEHVDYRQLNHGGGVYNINSIFGKGMIEAYQKAEQQDWAGTVIDPSIIEFLNEKKISPDDYLEKFAKKYKIPYKKGSENVKNEEYAYRLIVGNLDEEAYKNYSETIERNFSEHKKDVTDLRVQLKLENTLKYLESFKEQL